MSEFDEFSEYLRGEWFVGRANAAYDEMWQTLSDLNRKRTMRRQREILAAASAVPLGGMGLADEMVVRTTTAHVQAMAENVLLAVAIYLARHESPPPEE